jgi:hypothetical protein
LTHIGATPSPIPTHTPLTLPAQIALATLTLSTRRRTILIVRAHHITRTLAHTPETCQIKVSRLTQTTPQATNAWLALALPTRLLTRRSQRPERIALTLHLTPKRQVVRTLSAFLTRQTDYARREALTLARVRFAQWGRGIVG